MEFGRMFDQYFHKGSENFLDLSLSVPEASSHSYMSDQGNYGSYESGVVRGGSSDGYPDMNSLAPSSLGGHEAPTPPHTAPHTVQQHSHPQAMYQMGVVGGLHGGNNPQFPPQNLYIPPISQHGTIMAAQSAGFIGQGIGPGTPVYTSAGMGLQSHHQPHPMMGNPAAMMPSIYYQRLPVPRSGGSPNSGGSPSPGSEDSDDSTPIGQGRGKRPSPEVPVEPPPAKGKKARVSKKSKKKKDPNEPQKPVSAYALFFRDTQAAIKGQNPNASFGEVSKIVASMWDGLDADNKSVYKKKTEAAKKEYLKALAAYRASLVSKGEGDPSMYGASGQPYPPFGGANTTYGFPATTTSGPISPHPQSHIPSQLSPLGKKSPLLNTMMTTEGGQQAMMNPPMSQPMPPSAPQMMPHGPMPMNLSSMGPQGQNGPPPHQQGTSPSALMNPMTTVPSSPPFMTQTNPSLSSPVSSMGSDVGSPSAHTIHKPTAVVVAQSQQQQQQQSQPQHQPSPPSNSHQQRTSPHPIGHHPMHHHGSNQGGGHPVSVPGGTSVCNGGSCIRSGCTNPAVHNPEWEDEYCSNECVVSHCRDVFNSWVASGQGNAPTYPAPVK